ncbi:MAG: hypothetical protein PVG79_03600 [Gemmatimonadales bacterium]|jgi:hypothetical protein
METHDALRAGVLEFIGRGVEAAADAGDFERLALEVFAYQFAENEPYRKYCERRGRAPDAVARWTEIPAVPTAAFKAAPLICGDPQEAEIVFQTSGTTGGPERRGAHHVRDLSLYEASALPNFRAHMLPDGAQLPMLILGPTLETAPDSSLAWMLERVRRAFGADGSAQFVDESGLRVAELEQALAASESAGKPVALLGTAAAFAHLLVALEARRRRVRLPAGSRVMETGGFKRLGRELLRDELYGMLVERLGLSEFYCVAEYGMTEMCSQFYDNVLRERARGRSPVSRHKVVPPWVRTQVVDAETLEPCPEGRLGLLEHLDLANLDSVMAIQTDDLGVAGPVGFELMGRAAGAELRGCSIAMDQWLSAQR